MDKSCKKRKAKGSDVVSGSPRKSARVEVIDLVEGRQSWRHSTPEPAGDGVGEGERESDLDTTLDSLGLTQEFVGKYSAGQLGCYSNTRTGSRIVSLAIHVSLSSMPQTMGLHLLSFGTVHLIFSCKFCIRDHWIESREENSVYCATCIHNESMYIL